MRRIARVTEDLGCDGGGFYVEAPDIPEGLSCHEWRCRRGETSTVERSPRPRPSFRLPALRPQAAFPRLPLAEATP
jgi:hypothetical protein